MAGLLTEFVVVGDERLIKVPDHLSLEEASTLPVAGGTACYSLFFLPDQQIGKNTWVLVQGTGGVSTIAIQVRDWNDLFCGYKLTGSFWPACSGSGRDCHCYF